MKRRDLLRTLGAVGAVTAVGRLLDPAAAGWACHRRLQQPEGSNPPDCQFSCARAPLSTPRSP